MSLQEQQNFLARLYTDAQLRRAFLFAPAQIGAEHNLNENEIAEIAEIMPEELNFFADSLFWKRLREVEKMLPLTRKTLGVDFTVIFREFSQNFIPRTVKKHLEDAFEYCQFLQKQDISEIAKNAARFEQSKLEFVSFGKRIVYCKLDFDFREIYRRESETQSINLKKRITIAVWLRIGKKTKHFFI